MKRAVFDIPALLDATLEFSTASGSGLTFHDNRCSPAPAPRFNVLRTIAVTAVKCSGLLALAYGEVRLTRCLASRQLCWPRHAWLSTTRHRCFLEWFSGLSAARLHAADRLTLAMPDPLAVETPTWHRAAQECQKPLFHYRSTNGAIPAAATSAAGT